MTGIHISLYFSNKQKKGLKVNVASTKVLVSLQEEHFIDYTDKYKINKKRMKHERSRRTVRILYRPSYH